MGNFKSSKQFITSFPPQPQWPAMFLTWTILSAWVLERGRGENLSANLEEHVAWARNKLCGFKSLRFWPDLPTLTGTNNSIFSGKVYSQVYAVSLHLITETHAKGFPITLSSNATEDRKSCQITAMKYPCDQALYHSGLRYTAKFQCVKTSLTLNKRF